MKTWKRKTMNRNLPCIHKKDCGKCFNKLRCPHYDTGEDRTDYDEYETEEEEDEVENPDKEPIKEEEKIEETKEA